MFIKLRIAGEGLRNQAGIIFIPSCSGIIMTSSLSFRLFILYMPLQEKGGRISKKNRRISRKIND